MHAAPATGAADHGGAVRTLALCILLAPSLAQAWGYIGHVAGYAAAGVAAHEVNRYLDNQKSGKFPASAALPNPNLTPGAIDPGVTQYNIGTTICRRGGYTKSVRPPEDYTEKLKRRQIAQYGYADTNMRDYEEDHLVSLELGGSPDNPMNLWPEPHDVDGGWGSYAKDQLENRLHDLVCARRLSLAQAQHDIATNWVQAYQRYIGGSYNGGSR